MAVSLSTGSSPLILVTPTITKQQRQIIAIKQFYPKIIQIHALLESRVAKMKLEGIGVTKIESDLKRGTTQLSTLKENVDSLDIQINFGTSSASTQKSVDTKIRNTISGLKTIYSLEKQIIANVKKITPVVKNEEPASVSAAVNNL